MIRGATDCAPDHFAEMILKTTSIIRYGIYVVTDEALSPERSHIEIARAALEGGASFIQLRDKRTHFERLIAIGLEIRRFTAEAGALFIVNDYVEIALACDADGLHVGQGDLSAATVRNLLPGKLLGVSVSCVEEAIRAREDGADYVGFGPIFSTSTKLDAGLPLGLEEIAHIRSSCGLPLVAIGGINESNISQVAAAGADYAGVISAVVCAPDMTEATRNLARLWEKGRGE